mgnify:CR=1 FL=1
MKTTPKKKKEEESMLSELIFGIIGLFLGDITTKIGWALLSLLIGIALLTRSIVDNGIALKKSVPQYTISSILILFAVGLIISWIRKRKTK